MSKIMFCLRVDIKYMKYVVNDTLKYHFLILQNIYAVNMQTCSAQSHYTTFIIIDQIVLLLLKRYTLLSSKHTLACIPDMHLYPNFVMKLIFPLACSVQFCPDWQLVFNKQARVKLLRPGQTAWTWHGGTNTLSNIPINECFPFLHCQQPHKNVTIKGLVSKILIYLFT